MTIDVAKKRALIRAGRVVLFVGVSAMLTELISLIPSLDLGAWQGVAVAILSAALAGVDKYHRDLESTRTHS